MQQGLRNSKGLFAKFSLNMVKLLLNITPLTKRVKPRATCFWNSPDIRYVINLLNPFIIYLGIKMHIWKLNFFSSIFFLFYVTFISAIHWDLCPIFDRSIPKLILFAISRSVHRTPNFTNPEFQLPKFKGFFSF